VAVHAAVGQQAKHMQAAGLGAVQRVGNHRIIGKAALFDVGVDAATMPGE
jgi:hypothetical protein